MRTFLLLLLTAMLTASWALAAGLPCGRCGALNPPRAARCAVCGGTVNEPAANASPKDSPAPSPRTSPAVAPSPRPASPAVPAPVETPEGPPFPSGPARAAAARVTPGEDGNLVLESSPTGASVKIGLRTVGHTPLRETIKPGIYRVTLSLAGRESRRLRVRIRSGETTRKEIAFDPPAERSHGTGGRDPAQPAADRPAPSRRAPFPREEGWTGRSGTLVVEMMHRGDQTMASGFGIRIDGGAEAHGSGQTSSIASDLVHTYRFERAVRPGPHRVTIALMGVRTDSTDGSMDEVCREFEVFVAPDETRRLYHEWSGGVEEFLRTQPCCQRSHSLAR